MGGLKKAMPVTHLVFLIGTIAISGIPPFSGFFSKDEILGHVYEHNKLYWMFGVIGSMLTAFYMFRLYFLTFGGKFRGVFHWPSLGTRSAESITTTLIGYFFDSSFKPRSVWIVVNSEGPDGSAGGSPLKPRPVRSMENV